MTKISTIEGIGPVYQEKLFSAGISTIEALRKAGETPQQRKDLADSTGIRADLILGWVNRADLMRVKGIGEEYSDLLEKAGVDTVVELSRRNATNLYNKLVEVNEAHNLVRRLPRPVDVEAWVEHAKTLPRGVTY